MKDLSYLKMRALFHNREKQNGVSFKLEELEDIWICTRKNVKRKLKKFGEQQLLSYKPGKGRGNSSYLIFNNDFQKEVESVVREYMEKNQLEEIIHVLQLPIPKVWFSNVSMEIQELFGLQSKTESKDILRTILSRDITTLDPLYSSVTLESYLINQLGDTLVIYDQEKDAIKPHLAHHWLVDKQSMEWTFYLRKGVRFHHQGFLTSEDVKYTFDRFSKETSPQYWLVQDIRKIECPTKYTIKFHLKRSNPFFIRYVSAMNLVILPKDTPFSEYRWIGTGPFQLKERNESKLILKAFDNYFLERPFLDEVEFWRMPMNASRVVTYLIKKKEDEKGVALEGKNPKSTNLEIRDIENGFRFMAFNFKRKSIVHHHSFRKAMYHLLDTKRMYQELGRESFVEASSFFPWHSKPQQRDRKKVKKYLVSSGYQGEELTLFSLDYPLAIEEAKWIIKEAALEGIKLKHVSFGINQFYSTIIDKEADLLLMGEVATLDYHLSFLGAFYNQALFFQRLLLSEQLQYIETLLERFKFESNFANREYWMEEIERYLREEHLILFQNHPIKSRAFHPMIQDIQFESFGFVDIQKLWIP